MATGCYTLTSTTVTGTVCNTGVVGDYTLVDGDGNVLAQMVAEGTLGLRPWLIFVWRQATTCRMH